MYDFELPWPPTVNHYHQPIRVGKGARIIKSAKAKAYKEVAMDAIDSLGLANERLEGNLSVSMVLHPPTKAKYDIDNWTKGVFDALSYAEFWGDDKQVTSLRIKKGEKIKGGKVVVGVDYDE